jgi:hypothetical protein
MGITRYEQINVNNLTFTTDSSGQGVTVITQWFQTRARVMDVTNALQIGKDDRVYTDIVKFVLNYTPNTQTISENQSQYSVTWRGNDWRITDVIESNDRMNVTLLCYRNAPGAAV